MTKEITIEEAMCGVEFILENLDKSITKISSGGVVIQPEQIMTVKEKGMPFHKNPFKFGNLFILFKVKLPLTITSSEQGSIRKLFQ